eukprot:TRINITY_DN8547_c0_g1_i2.p1 TRINITY_DN8547_c0_g1~~TRINITY_DN8547_c0_g1_i2.p1  ORF type:complete len:108 (+),score=0.81 TRINITY_DN8547_c0_g1_i2:102-425(+)
MERCVGRPTSTRRYRAGNLIRTRIGNPGPARLSPRKARDSMTQCLPLASAVLGHAEAGGEQGGLRIGADFDVGDVERPRAGGIGHCDRNLVGAGRSFEKARGVAEGE